MPILRSPFFLFAVLAVLVLGLAGCGEAEKDSAADAERLLKEATSSLRDAGAESDLARREALYKNGLDTLCQITRLYPESGLAKRLLGGMEVAGHSLSNYERALAETKEAAAAKMMPAALALFDRADAACTDFDCNIDLKRQAIAALEAVVEKYPYTEMATFIQGGVEPAGWDEKKGRLISIPEIACLIDEIELDRPLTPMLERIRALVEKGDKAADAPAKREHYRAALSLADEIERKLEERAKKHAVPEYRIAQKKKCRFDSWLLKRMFRGVYADGTVLGVNLVELRRKAAAK